MTKLFVFLLLFSHPLYSELSIGAEPSSIVRMRAGGTKQRGQLDGVRFIYNRMKPLYVGGDFFCGKAQLEGHSATNHPLSSLLIDRVYEGRLGLCILEEAHFFSLFLGYGYFYETNDFTSHYKFTNSYNYIPLGFLSGVNFNSLFAVGFNAKFMFMQNAKSVVSGGVFDDIVTLKINEEINARVEIPCIFSPPEARMNVRFGLIPFYEYRHYGGREGFPYNYIDTKYILFGARIALLTSF